MEFLVAILIIALIAAIAFGVMQRRPGSGGLGRAHSSPLPRRSRASARRDPMAAAVAQHAEANDPQSAVVAEERLQAQARQVAAGLNTEAQRTEHQRAAEQIGHGRADGHVGDPATAPAYDEPRVDRDVDPAADPRHDDRKYDGRPASDYVDPRHDEPRR